MMPSIQDSQTPALPSKRQLATTTAMALAVATTLLVTVVLPAEYGLDPLRTGKALGLTRLSDPPSTPDVVAAPAGGAALTPTIDGPIGHYPAPFKSDTTQFVLGPYEFVEYKYRLEKGAIMLYSWTGTAAVVHDFHGEPQGGGENAAVSYEKKPRRDASGSFTAPFSGIHGWYWENPGADPITVNLTSAGFYSAALEIRSDRTRRTHELR
jgi:hypothetical protein